MYQMIYRISINLYRYEYRIEKTDRYPALIDIRCLWAQSTEHKLNNTSNSKPDWNEAEYHYF